MENGFFREASRRALRAYRSLRHRRASHADLVYSSDPDALRELVLGGMETSMRTTAKEQAKAAIVEDEASVIFFSCTLWGGMTGLIAEELEAVILDPVITPLKYVELLAAQNKY